MIAGVFLCPEMNNTKNSYIFHKKRIPRIVRNNPGNPFLIIIYYFVILSSHFNIAIMVNMEVKQATTNTVQVKYTGMLL